MSLCSWEPRSLTVFPDVECLRSNSSNRRIGLTASFSFTAGRWPQARLPRLFPAAAALSVVGRQGGGWGVAAALSAEGGGQVGRGAAAWVSQGSQSCPEQTPQGGCARHLLWSRALWRALRLQGQEEGPFRSCPAGRGLARRRASAGMGSHLLRGSQASPAPGPGSWEFH